MARALMPKLLTVKGKRETRIVLVYFGASKQKFIEIGYILNLQDILWNGSITVGVLDNQH